MNLAERRLLNNLYLTPTPTPTPPKFYEAEWWSTTGPGGWIILSIYLSAIVISILFLFFKFFLPFFARYLGYLVREFNKGKEKRKNRS
jgi:hypothetical protein